MTARPSPSLPQTTKRQQKPGPRGCSRHWRRTRNHSRPSPWPASWPNQASAADSYASYDRILYRHGREATSNEQAACLNDAAARHHLAHHPRRPRLASGTRQSTSPRRGRRSRSTTPNRPGTAHGHRTGPCTRRSPRHLQPPDSADRSQTRRSPAKRSRLHPRPDRRGLPRQQRANPPGPPLGPGGPRHLRECRSRASPSPPTGTRSPANSASTPKRRRPDRPSRSGTPGQARPRMRSIALGRRPRLAGLRRRVRPDRTPDVRDHGIQARHGSRAPGSKGRCNATTRSRAGSARVSHHRAVRR